MSGCFHELHAAGFIIDTYASAYINLATDKANNTIPTDIQELLKKGDFHKLAKTGQLPGIYSDTQAAMECLGETAVSTLEFDGTVTTIFPEKVVDPKNQYQDSDVYDPVYIPAKKKPSLFEAAYPTPEALLDEIKAVFKAKNIEFPQDFDWWARIVYIDGSEFF